jgi:hypothetical protein
VVVPEQESEAGFIHAALGKRLSLVVGTVPLACECQHASHRPHSIQ